MKKSKRTSPVWPYLVILAFLFVLSVTAPRAWHRKARQEPILAADPITRREMTSPAKNTVALERDDASEREPRRPEWRPPSETSATSASDSQPVLGIEPPAPEFADQISNAPASDPAPEVAYRPQLPELPAAPVPKPKVPASSGVAPSASEAVPSASPTEPVADEDPTDLPSAPAIAASTWPLPRVLLEQLTALVHEDGQLVWARARCN